MSLTRRQKVFLFIGGPLAIFLVIGIYSQRHSGIWVDVEALPSDSTITMDGQTIKAGRTKLTPGTHTFVATRKYFDKISKTIATKNLNTKQTIYLLPLPNSPESLKYLADHPDVQKERESASSDAAAQTQQQISTQYPYTGGLPYQTTDFLVDYSYDANGKITLLVTIYPITKQTTNADAYNSQVAQFKQEAQDYLKSQHVNLASTTINYSVDTSQSN